ncbi:MAG: excinuclease ABC subunit UvrA [Verrucomicrobia bacterium]|nr:excinuclease ABC subunit UvrA [Verrucomicrobiota bacterium]
MAKVVRRRQDAIVIRGARQNNLQGIDLELGLNRLHVITGPSGSGKSSLAFDTVYAEGQRRYVETFSPYTRQFLDRMDKPAVDEILGIPPAIAIEQANRVRTTRSTVGTMTEINDYLKLLMARAGCAFCPDCRRQIVPESAESIAQQVERQLAGRPVLVTFGVPVPPGTNPADFLSFLNQQGFLRVWLEGALVRTDGPETVKRLPGLVPVIQDRLTVNTEARARLSEAVECALKYGKGQLSILTFDEPAGEHRFSLGWHCPYCDRDIRPPSPGLFSFNNPLGACCACRGFGRTIGIDLARAIPDRRLSIAEGVVKPFQSTQMHECQHELVTRALEREVDIHAPFEELPEADQRWVINGDVRPGQTAEEVWESGGWYGVRGFFDWMEARTYKMHVRVFLSRYRTYTLCEACGGTRFQPDALNYALLMGGRRFTLPDLQNLPVEELARRMGELQISGTGGTGEMLRDQIAARLRYLVEVGLGYLTLDRSTRSLSGGEVQRVNLTTCLGASLVNTLFVLDEPSVGLHPRDIDRLVSVLQGLRDKGNTLLVVEHEEAVMQAADNLVEIGPGRGEHGGKLVFSGPMSELGKAPPESLTAAYLTGRKRIAPRQSRRRPRDFLEIVGAREHNLKHLTARVPLGVFCCVTGVSGSGKSTLIRDVLYENLIRLKGQASEESPGQCDRLVGAHKVDEVLLVDQSPLARSPRSTPAVYVGIFDRIREMFASAPAARAASLAPGVFSFNSGTGRCDRCGGLGYEKVEMQFLSDQYVRCAECEGKRYQPHVLDVRLAGKNIYEVLQLTVTEAIEFFTPLPYGDTVIPALQLLGQVGLGYLRLGQPVNVLSGGESQRLKLVGHLSENAKHRKRALLIFDEPTTGLHFDDIAALLEVFQQLVERGNSLLVIEHNLDVIQSADYILDLGPEAGQGGGELIAAGTPEEVATVERSYTARFLRERLSRTYDPLRFNGNGRVAEAPPRALPAIAVYGARHHNLKDVSLRLPLEQMVVITGLSGSGKSSLAFDILFAEGQRRFLDSMSTYARQFVEQLERPDVDHVEGLPPAVAIEQRVSQGGGKSTVATVTEVYHFLRLLFAKLGTQYCPECSLPVAKQGLGAITRQVRETLAVRPALLLAPLVKARKGYHKEVAAWAERAGYKELLVDNVRCAVADFPELERYREHTIEVVVASLAKGQTGDLQGPIKTALELGNGSAFLLPAAGRRVILSSEMTCPSCGKAFEELDPRLFSFNSPHGWCTTCRGFGYLLPYDLEDERAESMLEAELIQERRSDQLDERGITTCGACNGERLNPAARAVRVQGLTISDFTRASVRRASDMVARLRLTGTQLAIAGPIVTEIRQRLFFMQQVGLDYLVLNRAAKTLSGGEAQRIRLAAQLGSNLRGVLYVLDEPTIGLHPRDNDRLLATLEALKRKGNTLVVVEHDEETMRRADTILDLGPGAGRQGGQVIALGPLAEIKKNRASITGLHLRKPMVHPLRGARRPLNYVPWLEVGGARANNLKGIDVRFPIGRLSVITGVSGSGKSTLLRSVLLPAVSAQLSPKPQRKGPAPAAWSKVRGAEYIGGVYEVDQSPIGKTSRSIPATYVKVFDEIRNLFAQLPEARIRGYSASRFSFNMDGGRCEACGGQGVIKLEMNFLPASLVPCESCGGKRFNAQTLAVQFNGKSIGDVLDMTIDEAATFFRSQPKIHQPLELLASTGLGYLGLGQSSPTLSGGEAQRLKLVSELKRGVTRALTDRLRRNQTPRSNLYLLEEPTIGLHLADVRLLIEVLQRLVDEGNTVIVIEHNLNVMAEADYLVDIGPEAGESGGEVVVAGAPEDVARHPVSRTAPFLRKQLKL